MANSFVRYTGNGSTTAFAIPFTYIDSSHLACTVNGVTTSFTLNSAGSQATLSSAPANGSAIEFRRSSSQTTRLTDYVSGAVLTESALDTDSTQGFFMSQEAVDDANDKITLDNADFQWSANSKRIKNVTDPTGAQDVATKNYLENTWLSTANKTALTTVNANIANINAVNSNASNVNTVAGNTTNINTVATNIASVNTVATDIAKVITVANDLAEAVSEVETVADDLNETTSEIDTVANAITNVNNVGTNIANVNTVAGVSSNVTTVAGISSNVTAVAGKATEIGRLGTTAAVADMAILGTTAAVADMAILGTADVVADMNTLGTSDVVTDMNLLATSANVTNMATLGASGVVGNIATVSGISGNVTTVAGISSNVTAVANDASDIGAVAAIASAVTAVNSNSSNINAVNSNSSNINTVAGISSNVTTVANANSNITAVAGNASNINTVGAAITNVNNVGGSIANVNTVASNLSSVNAFGEQYRVGSSNPTTSLDEGDLFFNTTDNTLKVYDGTGWTAGVTLGSGFLPLTGGGLTGALTTNSTIDGRDIANDGSKLDSIEASATADQTASEIRTLVESASDSNVFTDADHTKLNGIEASATADQSNAEIRTAVEAATDSNVFTDADHTKLNGIEASADVTDATNVTAAGALMDSEVTNLAQVKAFSSADYATAAQGTLATNALPKAGGTMTGTLKLNDNVVMYLGTGDDLQLKHDGSNSFLRDVGSGDLIIEGENNIILRSVTGSEKYIQAIANGGVVLYHDDTQKISTTSSGGNINGDLTVSGTVDGVDIATRDGVLTSTTTTANAALPKAGGTMTGNIAHGDNVKATFGASNDLEIYHDGSNSFIKDVGTGGLYLRGDTVISLGVGSESAVRCAINGDVKLYYDDAEKLATTSGGVSVTGDMTASGNVTAYSDERLKDNIKTIDNALDKVSQMRGVTFERKDTRKKDSGVIAQEIEKVAPELVIDGEFKSVAYGNTVGYLIEAIKELKAELDNHKSKCNCKD